MAADADSTRGLTLVLDDEIHNTEVTEEYDDEPLDDGPPDGAPDSPADSPAPSVRRAVLLGSAIVVSLSVLVGWLGFRAYQAHQEQALQSQLLQAARQGALNLTTIDWQHAEGDMQRILDGATGQFRDEFASRSQPFIEVVKQAKSTSVGTITEAGLESEEGGHARVLVAVAVKTSTAGAPEQDPRAWRMRITVQKDGDQAKVSNVEFVA
jgi:Mce-associated membrane protein